MFIQILFLAHAVFNIFCMFMTFFCVMCEDEYKICARLFTREACCCVSSSLPATTEGRHSKRSIYFTQTYTHVILLSYFVIFQFCCNIFLQQTDPENPKEALYEVKVTTTGIYPKYLGTSFYKK